MARVIATLVLTDERQQREETLLVKARTRELERLAQRDVFELSYLLPDDGHANPDEAVTFAVLALAGLEEAL